MLGKHPAVREAAVTVRDGPPANRRLVAFVAVDRTQRVTPDDLRAYLKDRLPEHTIPSAYIILERLPLTANGKIDRAALSLNYAVAEPEAEFMSPRTPAEELVARVWKEVLGVERVSVNSSFFDLGGYSLLATQIILRLREIFRVEVPVRAMFETPTVCGIIETMSKIWEGREIVEEIAWTYLKVEQLSDQDVVELLATPSARSHCDDRACHPARPHG